MDEHKYKVLVVDNEEEFAYLVSKMFKTEGYDTREAITGEDAIKLIDKERFDVVALDISLDGITGIDVLNKIRTDSDSSNAVVIMMTGHTKETEWAIAALNGGADSYFTKPEGIVNIISVVKEKLENREDEELARDLERRFYRTERAITIASESMTKAKIESEKIVREGKANGKILDAFIRGAN